jgi:F-type H+-transporting ATPase subunit epsilon
MLKCIVVTPEKTVRDEAADFVALPLYDGEIGIAQGHSPMIGRLGYGEMRIRQGDASHRYYVEGGFVEVLADVVSVITHRAIPAAELDLAAAEEQLHKALAQPAKGPELMELRDRAVAQARAQVHLASKRGIGD